MAGQDGPIIPLAPGISTQLAGGGGGGWAYNSSMPANYVGSLAGKGGGGAGAQLLLRNSTVLASRGKAGLPNTGGGGGGGAACDIPGAANGDTQRTYGGDGGSGVAIIAFEILKTSVAGFSSISVNAGLTKLPLIEIRGPFSSDYVMGRIRALNGVLEGNLQVRMRFGRLFFDNVFLNAPSTGGTSLVIEMPGYETIVLPVIVR